MQPASPVKSILVSANQSREGEPRDDERRSRKRVRVRRHDSIIKSESVPDLRRRDVTVQPVYENGFVTNSHQSGEKDHTYVNIAFVAQNHTQLTSSGVNGKTIDAPDVTKQQARVTSSSDAQTKQSGSCALDSFAAGTLLSSCASHEYARLRHYYVTLSKIKQLQTDNRQLETHLVRAQLNGVTSLRQDGVVLQRKLENLWQMKELYAELSRSQFDARHVTSGRAPPLADVTLSVDTPNVAKTLSFTDLRRLHGLNTQQSAASAKKPRDAVTSFELLLASVRHLPVEEQKRRIFERVWTSHALLRQKPLKRHESDPTQTKTQKAKVDPTPPRKLQPKKQDRRHPPSARRPLHRPLYGYHIGERGNRYERYIERLKELSKAHPSMSQAELKETAMRQAVGDAQETCSADELDCGRASIRRSQRRSLERQNAFRTSLGLESGKDATPCLGGIGSAVSGPLSNRARGCNNHEKVLWSLPKNNHNQSTEVPDRPPDVTSVLNQSHDSALFHVNRELKFIEHNVDDVHDVTLESFIDESAPLGGLDTPENRAKIAEFLAQQEAGNRESLRAEVHGIFKDLLPKFNSILSKRDARERGRVERVRGRVTGGRESWRKSSRPQPGAVKIALNKFENLKHETKQEEPQSARARGNSLEQTNRTVLNGQNGKHLHVNTTEKLHINQIRNDPDLIQSTSGSSDVRGVNEVEVMAHKKRDLHNLSLDSYQFVKRQPLQVFVTRNANGDVRPTHGKLTSHNRESLVQHAPVYVNTSVASVRTLSAANHRPLLVTSARCDTDDVKFRDAVSKRRDMRRPLSLQVADQRNLNGFHIASRTTSAQEAAVVEAEAGQGWGSARGSRASSEDESKLSTNSSNETFIVKHSPTSDPDLDHYVTLNSTLTSETEHDVTLQAHPQVAAGARSSMEAIPSAFRLSDPAKPFRINGYTVHPPSRDKTQDFKTSLTLPRYRNPPTFESCTMNRSAPPAENDRVLFCSKSLTEVARENRMVNGDDGKTQFRTKGSTCTGKGLTITRNETATSENTPWKSVQRECNRKEQVLSKAKTTKSNGEVSFEDQYCADVRDADRKLHSALYTHRGAHLPKHSNVIMTSHRNSLPLKPSLNQSHDSYFFARHLGEPVTADDTSTSRDAVSQARSKLSRSRPVNIGAYNVRRQQQGSKDKQN